MTVWAWVSRGSARHGVILYLVGAGLLLGAWIFGNPAGAGPDEISHYVRAVAAGEGSIVGMADPYTAVPEATGGSSPVALRQYNAYVRGYRIPGYLVTGALACNRYESTVPATCESEVFPHSGGIERSQHADQPPLPYVLAGPVMTVAASSRGADWLGRSTLAAFCLLLLGAPLALSGGYRRRVVVGLVVALTPMVFFTGAIINPSGLETFSSIGFFVSLLALVDGRYPRGSLVVAASTGVFLTMSRPFAPLWMVVAIVGVVGLVGVEDAWRAASRHPRGSVAAAAVAVLGAVSTLLFVTRFPAPPRTSAPAFGWSGLHNVTVMAVGDFGWLDAPLPPHAADAWLVVVTVLTATAVWCGSGTERVAVAAVTILCAGLTYGLSVLFLLPTGVGPQGRHFLPILVLQPLVTTMVVSRATSRPRTTILRVSVLGMEALQLIGWISNGTREGLGIPAPRLSRVPGLTVKLLGHPAWSPPGGFLPWLIMLTVGCLLMLRGTLTGKPSREPGLAGLDVKRA